MAVGTSPAGWTSTGHHLMWLGISPVGTYIPIHQLHHYLKIAELEHIEIIT